MRNHYRCGNQQGIAEMKIAYGSDRVPEFSKVTFSVSLLVYLLMLVYGTLYPFSGWQIPEGGFFQHFLEAEISNLSRTDMITNVLIYIPAGLLWMGFWARRITLPTGVLLAGLLGVALSFSLEAIQVFLPTRTSALSDLFLNGMGAAIGGGIALILSGHTRWGVWLHNLRNDTYIPGALTSVGLIVFGLWGLSQLSPLVPSLSISNLRNGVKPIWFTVTGQSTFLTAQCLVYFCSVIALGGIFLSVCRARGPGLLQFGLILTMVLLMKIPVLSRQLSLEALLGCMGAVAVLIVLHRASNRFILICAGCFLLTSYVVDALQPSTSSLQMFAFNWIPFKGHMQNIVGLANILASGWVFLGLGYVVRFICRPSLAFVAAVTGALLVVGLVTLMEILQLGIPGRVPDMTDVLIAVVAWTGAWVGGRGTAPMRKNPHQYARSIFRDPDSH